MGGQPRPSETSAKNWYIGIFRLPENPKCRLKAKSSSKPAVRAAKAGSTSIKLESAVRATHKASGISVRVESGRSQHANKTRVGTSGTIKLAEHQTAQNADYAKQQHSGLYQVSAVIRNGYLKGRISANGTPGLCRRLKAV